MDLQHNGQDKRRQITLASPPGSPARPLHRLVMLRLHPRTEDTVFALPIHHPNYNQSQAGYPLSPSQLMHLY